MDKYKNFVVIEEIKSLMKEGRNEEALELTEGLDPKKIKDNCDCIVLAEVYLKNGMLGAAYDCFSTIYDRKKSRRIAMELVDICIRLKKADEAERYYEDYRGMSGNDYFNYIFKYKIDRLKNRPIKEQAASLEELKRVEFFDTWGYELAKLYHKMGETEKCLKTCEDVILWFGDGEAVDKAKALKAYYSGEISLKELSGHKESEHREKEDISEESVQEESVKEEPVEEEPVQEESIQETPEQKESVQDGMSREVPLWENSVQDGYALGAAQEESVQDGFVKGSVQDESAQEYISEEPVQEYYPEEPVQEYYPEESVQEYIPEEQGGEHYPEEPVQEYLPEAPDSGYYPEEAIQEYLPETQASGYYPEEMMQEYYPEEPVQEYYPEEPVQEYYPEKRDKEDEPEEILKEYVPREPVRHQENAGIYTENEIYPEIDKISVVAEYAHDNSYFEDEIAKAVEQALMEDMAEKEAVKSEQKPEEMTRVWDKVKSDTNVYATEKTVETFEENSPLLDAVEKELGFIGENGYVPEPAPKKGWVARLRERRQEKDRRKEEEQRKAREEEEARIRKEKEAELEKQKFIEKEKKKDRQKFLDHQRQLAKIVSEKAKNENKNGFSGQMSSHETLETHSVKTAETSKEKTSEKVSGKAFETVSSEAFETVSEKASETVSEKASETVSKKASETISDKASGTVSEKAPKTTPDPIQDKEAVKEPKDKTIDTVGTGRMVTSQQNEGSIYKPKALDSVEIEKESPVYRLLSGKGKELQDYFGFFACQKNVGGQIVKCLEQMLDEKRDNMNLCILGDKGNGKKILTHGFSRFMADFGSLSSPQTVWTEAEKVNGINLPVKADRLRGKCLVINQAGTLSDKGLDDILKVAVKLKKEIMIILSDSGKDMTELFRGNDRAKERFLTEIEIPKFSMEDLKDYVDYKVGRAGFVFDSAAYDLMLKRINSIVKASGEGTMAQTEKYIVNTLDNAEQRNGEAYIRQTLVNERHVRSNVIISADLPDGI